VGGANCVVLQQDAALGSVATIVLRGSTEGFLDDVERAVDDGINAYKVNGACCCWLCYSYKK
jgi:T-complex protein 1 subunit theta